MNASSPSLPGSWNRYAYTQGDAVNFSDPTGLDDCGPGWMTEAWLSGPCKDPCDPRNQSQFAPSPSPPDPTCYAPSNDPSTGSSERTWKMYVVADKDCYKQFVGALGFVWERDIDYYAVKVYDDNTSEVLSGTFGEPTSVIR